MQHYEKDFLTRFVVFDFNICSSKCSTACYNWITHGASTKINRYNVGLERTGRKNHN